MADEKYSALTDGGGLAAGDEFAVARASASVRVTPIGVPVLVYRYTVTGSDKTSIDTGVDTPNAGSNDWTNGDLLEIYVYARTDEAVVNSFVDLIFNNDAGSVYDFLRTQNSGGSVIAGGSGNQTSLFWLNAGASAAANEFGYARLILPNYAGTTGYKPLELFGGNVDSGASGPATYQVNGVYRSTSAITRAKLFADTAGKKLKVGTQLLIYKRLAS